MDAFTVPMQSARPACAARFRFASGSLPVGRDVKVDQQVQVVHEAIKVI